MIQRLLDAGPVVINIGLRDFAATLETQHIDVVHVDWTPPQRLDPAVASVLEALE